MKTNLSLRSAYTGSVNESFLDALWKYPLGNGLGGGGTSIPYFLQDRLKNPVGNRERIRTHSAGGRDPGLLPVGRVYRAAIGGAPGERAGPWRVGWRLAWVTVALYFGTAFIGIGLLTAIPGTCLLLFMTGWMCVPKLKPVRVTAVR